MRVLVTGGAGFVGAHLARRFAERGDEVHCLDNLKRRGSEQNVAPLRARGVAFHHGDVRLQQDLDDLPGRFDVVVEASAEPSVHAGLNGDGVAYLVETNAVGTARCLEFVRRRAGGMIFLSTSRVLPIEPLRALPLAEEQTRLWLRDAPAVVGASARGIDETFPLLGRGGRSLYGATKLASEILVEEYARSLGVRTVVNRCGVLAGAGQLGRVDQGVFTLWMARHTFGGPLSFTGFEGTGKQVRCLLHPDDLFALLQIQIARLDELAGRTFHVGGGAAQAVSLLEWTRLCAEVSGRHVEVGRVAQTASVDAPWIVMDPSVAQRELGFTPRVGPRAIAEDIHGWLIAGRPALEPLFAPP